MKELAFIVGIAAVILYLLGYLQKKRGHIIFLNLSSRILYIVQYVLLSAFEGAALDVAGALSSLLAGKKDVPIIRKHARLILILMDLAIIAVGLALYQNPYSLLPIVGVLLHTSAFWLDNERLIRIVSFIGCPFWLIYNLASGAYGSCIGDFLSMVSIGISMFRYDFKPNAKAKNESNGKTNDLCAADVINDGDAKETEDGAVKMNGDAQPE